MMLPSNTSVGVIMKVYLTTISREISRMSSFLSRYDHRRDRGRFQKFREIRTGVCVCVRVCTCACRQVRQDTQKKLKNALP